jgi:chorismate mutase
MVKSVTVRRADQCPPGALAIWESFPMDVEDEAYERLTALRANIDNLDAAIVRLLAERFECTKEVGRLKASAGMPAADPAREAVQVARLREIARASALDPAFAEKFLRFVIDEVLHHHRRQAGRS